MLELEKNFAHSLHRIGQELFDLLEFNRTFYGVLLNKTIHRPSYVRSLKKQLFNLVSKIERHVIYRLRNTNAMNTELTLCDIDHLQKKVQDLISLIEKEKRKLRVFKFSLSPYLHWLTITQKNLLLYKEIKKEITTLDTDCSKFIQAIDLLQSEHQKTRKLVLPLWLRIYQLFFPDPYYKDFDKNLKKISQIEPSKELPQLYTLLLKKELLEKAMFAYRDNYFEDMPELFSNIDMTSDILSEIEKEIQGSKDPVNNYIERIRERLKVLSVDEALNHTGQFYQIASENLEQKKAFKNLSFMSLRHKSKYREDSSDDEEKESLPEPKAKRKKRFLNIFKRKSK